MGLSGAGRALDWKHSFLHASHGGNGASHRISACQYIPLGPLKARGAGRQEVINGGVINKSALIDDDVAQGLRDNICRQGLLGMQC